MTKRADELVPGDRIVLTFEIRDGGETYDRAFTVLHTTTRTFGRDQTIMVDLDLKRRAMRASALVNDAGYYTTRRADDPIEMW